MRRSRLPRIRLKALEAPDLRDIGRKLPHRMDGEGLDAAGVVSWYPSRRTIAPVRGHARQRAHSGIEHQLGRPRPADRTDDYSAADFVISEALQQTAFDEIRHGVLSGWTASSSRPP